MNQARTSEIVTQLRSRAKQANKRVIFPETADPRVQTAIKRLVNDNICQPVVLDNAHQIEGCEIFSALPDSQDLFERAAQTYSKLNAAKGVTLSAAREVLQTNKLLLSTLLVRLGYIDTGVAGSIASTADVLRACIKGIGLHPSSKLVSSFFLMDHPYRLMTYADCGVNPNPNAEQLAQIAIDSARSHQVLTGHEPKVALLSFSTLGSAEDESIDKMRTALKLIQKQAPSLNVCGELQADTALIPSVAEKKAPNSAVAGEANVLIFPDLNAGNIAYKLTERLAGADATGPILQGLDKPWVDLSRGCNSEDIINAAAIASLLSLNAT